MRAIRWHWCCRDSGAVGSAKSGWETLCMSEPSLMPSAGPSVNMIPVSPPGLMSRALLQLLSVERRGKSYLDSYSICPICFQVFVFLKHQQQFHEISPPYRHVRYGARGKYTETFHLRIQTRYYDGRDLHNIPSQVIRLQYFCLIYYIRVLGRKFLFNQELGCSNPW